MLEPNDCIKCDCMPIVYEVVPNVWIARCMTNNYDHNRDSVICHGDSRDDVVRQWNEKN